jgi:phosphate:Na+ symporter
MLKLALSLVVACCYFIFPLPVYAAEEVSFNLFTLLIGLFGGLALFLFGLDQLSGGLKKAAGHALKTMLSKLTSNRIMGAFTGAFVTGILNSSSVTTVLVVGFITAGVMGLQQSVGVIMGANIGSTVTAQLLAFNIAKYSLLPVAVGFFMLFISKKHRFQNYGLMIMGLGLVFFGMSVMSDAMYPLRNYQPFLDLLKNLENPVMGILAGAIFTGLVQSSAATVGIAIAMASGGILTLNTGIALALGANIGTCVTALMASFGKPPEAIRAAVVHVTFNVVGVLIWLPFISTLASIAVTVSPGSPHLEGAAQMAADVPRQIANANTIFNVLNTVIFIPFTTFFALFAQKLIKDLPKKAPAIEPLYLDKNFLDVPAIAFEGVRKELARAAGIIVEMIERFRDSFTKGDYEDLKLLVREDDKIDILEQASMEYLGKIRSQNLSEKDNLEHQCLMLSTVTLESLADVIETDLVEIANRSKGFSYNRSEKTRELLVEIYQNVHQAMKLLIPLIQNNDLKSALHILELKPTIKKIELEFVNRKSERLGIDVPNALKNIQIEVSAVDKLHRMYSFCRRIAKAHLHDKA